MYFYKDTNGLYYIGNDIFPAGKYLLRVYNNDNDISVTSSDTSLIILYPILITKIKKKNNSTYSDLTDLLSAVGDFFK